MRVARVWVGLGVLAACIGVFGCAAILGIGDPTSEGSVPDAGADVGPADAQANGADAGASAVVRPLALGAFGGCAIVKDGSVWCWTGDDQSKDLLGPSPDPPTTDSFAHPVAGLPPHVRALAIAMPDLRPASACAAFENGEVWCWGVRIPADPIHCYGELDRLGRGDYPPTPNGPNELKAFCNEADAEAHDAEARTGLPKKTLGNAPQPIMIPGGVRLTDVVMGGGQASALDPGLDGGVWCWGDDLVGAVGTGYTPHDGFVPHRVSAPQKVLENGTRGLHALVAGLTSTCAVGDGVTACWGANVGGALGTPPTATATCLVYDPLGTQLVPCVLTPTAIRAGTVTGPLFTLPAASCFVGVDGRYACFGSGESCVFGADTTNAHATAIVVDGGLAFEADAALSSGTGPVLCAIAADGGLSCLGVADRDLLGAGARANVNVPQESISFIDHDGAAGSADGGSISCSLSAIHIAVPVPVVGFVSSFVTMGAIGADGQVYLWGINAAGGLGHTPGSLGDDQSINQLNPTPMVVHNLPRLF